MEKAVKYWMTNPTWLGDGSIEMAGELMQELGSKKVMIVTDATLVKIGMVGRLQEILKKSDIDSVVFDKIMENPTDTVCIEGAEFAKENGIDGIIALGGGSPMDAAKAINILTKNPLPLDQYYESWNYEKAYPLICIPTTAGTGSENTIWAVITDTTTHTKRVCFYCPDYAILDPELTYDLPAAMTANTGMDAFSHAAGSVTTRDLNPFTQALGMEAIRLVVENLPTAVKEPHNKEARRNMMIASNLAGVCMSPVSCHLDHALAQCMGAAFHVAHGISCAWSIPEALAEVANERFDQIKQIADIMKVEYTEDEAPRSVGDKVAAACRELMREVNILPPQHFGITVEDIRGIAEIMLHDNCYPWIPKEMTIEEIRDFNQRVWESYLDF